MFARTRWVWRSAVAGVLGLALGSTALGQLPRTSDTPVPSSPVETARPKTGAEFPFATQTPTDPGISSKPPAFTMPPCVISCEPRDSTNESIRSIATRRSMTSFKTGSKRSSRAILVERVDVPGHWRSCQRQLFMLTDGSQKTVSGLALSPVDKRNRRGRVCLFVRGSSDRSDG